MRRLAATLLSFAAVAAPSAEACDCGGCPPASCGTSTSSSVGGNLLFLRSYGQRGPLRAIDTSSGRTRFGLPPGIASADGRVYVSASHPRPAVTAVHTYSAVTGRALAARRLAGGGWSVAGVSANGREVALLDAFGRRGLTRIAVLTRRSNAAARRRVLKGRFDVDAVSNDGRRVFLIQYLRSGYLVRLYDVAKHALAPRVLTEKGRPMQGVAWDAVASPDGHYLFTLYLRADGAAEIHTLDLVRGTAVCIDLPGGDAAAIQQYALVLAPGGRTLFAANPVLGVVATVDPAALRVVRLAHFRSAAASASPSQVAAVSHDGRTVYFTNGATVFRYDSAYGIVSGPYTFGRTMAAGLAFTRDDRRLLVVRADGRVLWLDAATGRRIGGG